MRHHPRSTDAPTLRQALSGMTFREKADYLWTYYRWVLAVVVLAAMLISIFASGIRNGRTRLLVGGYLANVGISDTGSRYLTDDWKAALGSESRYETVNLSTGYLSGDTNASLMQALTMIVGQELDYIILDESALTVFLDEGAFAPLDTVLSADTCAAWADRTVSHAYSRREGDTALALDITDTAFARDCLAGSGRVYLAFPGNRTDAVGADQILAYLTAWPGDAGAA